jgi:plastocyanin
MELHMIAGLLTLPRRQSALLLLMLLFVASLAAGACGGGSGGSGPTGTPGTPITPVDNTPVVTTSVTLKNTAFTPPSIVVAPGATVTFTNQDGIAHNVTFGSSSVHGVSDFTSGSADVVMPATPGVYNYQCTLHGGMTGSVKVQ